MRPDPPGLLVVLHMLTFLAARVSKAELFVQDCLKNLTISYTPVAGVRAHSLSVARQVQDPKCIAVPHRKKKEKKKKLKKDQSSTAHLVYLSEVNFTLSLT